MKLLSKISASTALLSLLIAQMSQGAFAKASDEDKKITFQKFFKDGVSDDAKFDAIIEYPISASHATILREYSDSDSVMLPSEGCSSVSFKGIMNSLKKFELDGKPLFPPTFPGEDGYWEELRKVAFAVGQLKKFEDAPDRESIKDPLPNVMPRITHLWNGKFDIIDVAKAVQAEFPGVYHRQLITEWLDADSLKRNSTLFQTPNPNMDFLRFQIMLSDLTGHAIRLVGPCDFSLKWHVGRPRPEEIIYKIQEGMLQLPNNFAKMKVFQDLGKKHLKSPTEFTAYEGEGSPNHPSYPAMHSASSSGSFWLDVTMNLTDEQRCEARMLDWSISYGRTVAGVHYESDNIAGLMVGQEILAQKLPQYLHDEYGADFDAVKDVVDARRFDWTNFTTSKCWTQSQYKKFRTVSKGETVKGHDEL